VVGIGAAILFIFRWRRPAGESKTLPSAASSARA
jgi:hypothetical protein